MKKLIEKKNNSFNNFIKKCIYKHIIYIRFLTFENSYKTMSAFKIIGNHFKRFATSSCNDELKSVNRRRVKKI